MDKKQSRGRPVSVNAEEIIQELKRRYPNGTSDSVSKLITDNPDIPWKSLQNKAAEYFGMPFTKHLMKEGILISDRAFKPSGISNEKELAELIETLKNRYKGKDKPTELKTLIAENPDLPISSLKNKNVVSKLLGTTPAAYLSSNGILQSNKSLSDKESLSDKDKLAAIEESLLESYKGKGVLPDSVDQNDIFTIKNNVLKKYIGDGGRVIIPDGIKTIGDFAFDGVKKEFSLKIPESVKKIGFSSFFRCDGLVSLSIPRRIIRQLKYFSTCPNLKEVIVSDSIKFNLDELEKVKDIVIDVENVIIDDIDFDSEKCHRFLAELAKDNNLFAIYNKRDNNAESKLEKLGLKEYFKKIFTVNSFESNFGWRIMSREYYFQTLDKEIRRYNSKGDSGEMDMLIISDENGFYQYGSWYSTIYYAPYGIQHELPSEGYVAQNYDEILKSVQYINTEYRLKNIAIDVECNYNAYV